MLQNVYSRAERVLRAEPILLPPDDLEFDKLSSRELECARLVAKGFSNKEVGQLLEISPWTVAAHLKATFLKLGIRRRAELAYLLRAQI